jgi:mono/diheme cytochrome c family protein
MPPVTGYGCDCPATTAVEVVEDILITDCGQCHGPNGNGAGGIDDINSIDQLVADGLVVPLDSEASPIVRVLFDGSMPPPSSGLPPVTEADITTVAQYIDNPRFWPGRSAPLPPVVDAGSPAPLLDAGIDGG